jgi:two-component system sensor histidine kinase BaeS
MSIRSRFILALCALALALVLGIVLLFQWRFDLGMSDYLLAQQELRLQLLADELAERWQEDPGWQSLRAEPKKFFRLARRMPGHERDSGGHAPGAHEAHEHAGGANLPPPPPLPILLLDADGRVLISRGEAHGKFAIRIPVRSGGAVVGYVASPRLAPLETEIDKHFREAQLRSLWAVSAFALLVAVLVAILLARHFTQPLQRLSRAAHRLTQQQYGIEVDDSRRDELGDLARDMRELALTLEQNQTARARWFADISHELRTPLAVLLGEIDALLDGIRPLTPERIASLQQEVLHLQRLVEDLYVLARADLGALHYRKHNLDFAELCAERVDAARGALQSAGLQLHVQLPQPGPVVHGDADRLQQLLDNLLGNSVRYTRAGGEVHVSVGTQGSDAVLRIEDSAPGVPDAALARVFDHLFRTDEARTRSTGGAGLGLAISKRIVEAHGGSIRAAQSALGGLCIEARLPLSAFRDDSLHEESLP